MQIGDQLTNDDPAYDTPTLQTTLFPLPESHPLPIREFLTTDQPRHRLAQQGASALSDAELLAVITGVPCLETAQRLLIAAGGLYTLGGGMSQPSLYALAADRAAPGRRGAAMATYTMGFQFGGGVGAVLWGTTIEHLGYSVSYACTVLPMLVAMGLVLLDRRKRSA